MAPIDTITAALKQAIIDALQDRQDELTAIAQAGGDKAGGGLLNDVGALSDVLGLVIEAVLLTDPPAELALQLVKQGENAGGRSGRSFGIGYMLGYAGFNMIQPALLPIQQKIATVFQTAQIDADTAAALVARGILTLQDGRNKAHEDNFSDDNFDDMVDAAQQRPEIGQVLELLNRKAIDEAAAVKALQRHGYDEFWQGPLLSLHRQLLSPADLALAQLRGVIDDTTMQGYADQLGVTPDDMALLIENTGEPPGVMELLEAYRRGFIDEPTLEHGIRQSRTRNEWIATIEKLRYAPMSTADAVRAVVEHYLSDDEGAAIAQQNGLLPEHWRPMVDSWGRPLSHEQMMALYHRGEATLDQVEQAFRESDLKDKYIDQAVALARTLIPERVMVAMVDHGVITRDEAIQSLKERGYNDVDADRLVRLGVAQRTTSHRTLSKSDILAMYSDALMNRAQAVDHLHGLGYSDVDAGEMIDLADYKRKASQLRLVERGIEASLKAHHLTQQQALAQLEQAGLDHTQAQILVDEWLQQRRIPTRTLTEKQILDAIGAKIFTPDDGRVRLHGLGFADVDVDVIFMLDGIQPTEPRQ